MPEAASQSDRGGVLERLKRGEITVDQAVAELEGR